MITPALVGLAINYTLLIPIYLNWVVKFLADMEMYMNAVDRVQQYAVRATEDYREQGRNMVKGVKIRASENYSIVLQSAIS